MKKKQLITKQYTFFFFAFWVTWGRWINQIVALGIFFFFLTTKLHSHTTQNFLIYTCIWNRYLKKKKKNGKKVHLYLLYRSVQAGVFWQSLAKGGLTAHCDNYTLYCDYTWKTVWFLQNNKNTSVSLFFSSLKYFAIFENWPRYKKQIHRQGKCALEWLYRKAIVHMEPVSVCGVLVTSGKPHMQQATAS